jgi:hypothetical protein
VIVSIVLVQLISNDKFKSAKHRVLANRVGPRISVACLFSTHLQPFNRLYGPIKELLSDDQSSSIQGNFGEGLCCLLCLKRTWNPCTCSFETLNLERLKLNEQIRIVCVVLCTVCVCAVCVCVLRV